MELLLGCGRSRDKRIKVNGSSTWGNLTTLDINPDHNPDIVWDLNDTGFPFGQNSFDEIHAYEVLEHCGSQGDYEFFFRQFTDFWRILKPGGILAATVPAMSSPWLWGDPSHTRCINREQLTFLHQPAYEQVGKTAMSDFRHIYKADFDIEMAKNQGDTFVFILKAVKPSRCIFG